MDVGLKRMEFTKSIRTLIVSILVLMDVGLKRSFGDICRADTLRVSILVLMDVGLKLNDEGRRKHFFNRFQSLF